MSDRCDSGLTSPQAEWDFLRRRAWSMAALAHTGTKKGGAEAIAD